MSLLTSKYENPFFTIIITTYNRSDIVLNAVQSVLNQTYDNWECIIIDDGSNDNTFNKLKDIIKQNDKFRYVFHKNKKQAYSKNVGILNSSAKYITFLDSDDLYLPNHLQLRYNILQDMHIDLLHGGVQIIGSEFVPSIYNLNEKISIHNCVIGGTFFIKSELINNIGRFDIVDYGDDTFLFKKILEHRAVIAKTNLRTYVYNRLSLDSICNNMNNE